ncbi:hypothetical protein BOBR111200_25140 [Bordetella bronchialis]
MTTMTTVTARARVKSEWPCATMSSVPLSRYSSMTWTDLSRVWFALEEALDDAIYASTCRDRKASICASIRPA